MKLSPVVWLFINVYAGLCLLDDIPGLLQRVGAVGAYADILLHVSKILLAFLLTGCAIYWLKSGEHDVKN